MKIKFQVEEDKEYNIIFYTNAEGNDVIRAPLLNKGTAFSEEEREKFQLNGLIPPHVLTIDQQIEKVHLRFLRLGTNLNLCKSCSKLDRKTFNLLKKNVDIARYNFLRDLQDRNEILFYAFAYRYINEIIPVIYTPTVGDAVLRYSRDSSRFRGLFFSPLSIQNANSILKQFRYNKPKIAVVTDNQGILGLGDQGIGGMNIPIGKLALYVLGSGIKPWETMPISLDVGTDNIDDLEDPYYLGYKVGRLKDKKYIEFIDQFVNKIKEKYPNILVQWEDFSRQNAFTILDKYRYKILSFNDDIQGTGSVALAGILNALRVTGETLDELKFLIYGAGAGGIGIARRIVSCLETKYGLTNKKACRKIVIFDSQGLVTDKKVHQSYKDPFKVSNNVYGKWDIKDDNYISLLETINNFKPNILIGTSGKYGHFNENILEAIIKNCEKPIIFPLSNPTSNSEANPQDIYKHTKGKALVATGSPYNKFQYKGKNVIIGQGNNFFIFPGVGFGAIISQGSHISDSVFTEASFTLSRLTSENLIKNGTLYPPFNEIRKISTHIALTTAKEISKKLGTPEFTLEQIKVRMWKPGYNKINKI
jgi:malate dehydrogenase (oxaloacetate-decarboxylating)